MKLKVTRLLILSTAVVLLTACGGDGAPLPDTSAAVETQMKATVEATVQAAPTDTPRKEPTDSSSKLDMRYAQEKYPPDLVTDVLNGLIEWPVDFNECIRKSVSEADLDMFKADVGSIDGMDKDAAALCLLSVELANPGSTDYLKNVSDPYSPATLTPALTPVVTPVPGQVVPTTPVTNTPISTTPATPVPTDTPRKEPTDSSSKLDMRYAQEKYPPDLVTDVLNGLIEWPVDFNECIRKSVSEADLDMFKADVGSIDGMDKDAAALCLLSVELANPGSTDYLKNVSDPSKRSTGREDPSESGIPAKGTDPDLITQAQKLFGGELYGNMTSNILEGSATSPEGFDECITDALGANRLLEIRSEVVAEPRDRDKALVCLFSLGYQPEELILSSIPVESVSSVYKYGDIISTSGSFVSGQDADMVLGALGFNDTGGPLLFNHPSGIATDGVRLLMADSYNNRVLIWNKLPTGNEAPDIVLGQEDFFTNAPGRGRTNLNWPKSIATDGQKVVVTDTYNNRILIWNEFPVENGEPADIALQGADTGIAVSKSNLLWPWGVWTDGTKLAITSTSQSSVLIWNTFPTRDNQPADIFLTGNGALGTPRQITSDGKSLIVGDHNANIDGQRGVGTFFWETFPEKDEQPYDYYMSDPIDLGTGAPWMRGDFTSDGKLLALGSALYIWDSFPEDENDMPYLSVIGGYKKWGASFMKATDHTTLAVAGERVFITTNYHTISVYNSIPTSVDQKPDFVIGGPDIYTNTLESNHFITNPTPASDGKSLFVASDAGYFYVWRNIPQESGAHPDYIYSIGPDSIAFSVGDITLHNNTLILVGREKLLKWNKLPLAGEPPDVLLNGQIGTLKIGKATNESLGITGVAMDDKYFYLGLSTDEIYVWDGFPEDDSEPVQILKNIRVLNLHSDGDYLVASNGDSHTVTVYRVADILTNPSKNVIGGTGINGAAGAYLGNGQLFVADNGFARVHIWNDVEDAIRGDSADAFLGNQSSTSYPQIGQDKLFLPKFLTYDGNYLWVGEVKFSNRLLRFSHN